MSILTKLWRSVFPPRDDILDQNYSLDEESIETLIAESPISLEYNNQVPLDEHRNVINGILDTYASILERNGYTAKNS
jgi:hypothetical protein